MVDSKAAHVERGPTHSTLPSPPSTPGIDDGGSTVKKRKREAVEQVDNIPRKKKESVGSAGVGEPTAAASTSSGSTKNSSGTKNGTRLLANFIVAALGERLRGDFQNFQHLLTVFKDVPVGGDGGGDATEERGAVRGTTGSTIQAQRQRQRWLRALTQTVSHLGRKEYAPLVDAVLAVNVAGAARAMTIDGELLDMTFVDVVWWREESARER